MLLIYRIPTGGWAFPNPFFLRFGSSGVVVDSASSTPKGHTMPDIEDRDPKESPEEVEVVAHTDEEDEELNAGCTFNSSAQL